MCAAESTRRITSEASWSNREKAVCISFSSIEKQHEFVSECATNVFKQAEWSCDASRCLENKMIYRLNEGQSPEIAERALRTLDEFFQMRIRRVERIAREEEEPFDPFTARFTEEKSLSTSAFSPLASAPLPQKTEIAWSKREIRIAFPSMRERGLFLTHHCHEYFDKERWNSPSLQDVSSLLLAFQLKEGEAEEELHTLAIQISTLELFGEQATVQPLQEEGKESAIVMHSLLRIEPRLLIIGTDKIYTGGLEQFAIYENDLYLKTGIGFRGIIRCSPYLPQTLLKMLFQTDVKGSLILREIAPSPGSLYLQFNFLEDVEGFRRLAFLFFPEGSVKEEKRAETTLTYALPTLPSEQITEIAIQIRSRFSLSFLPPGQRVPLGRGFKMLFELEKPHFIFALSLFGPVGGAVSCEHQTPHTQGLVPIFRAASSAKSLQTLFWRLHREVETAHTLDVRSAMTGLLAPLGNILSEIEVIERHLEAAQVSLPPSSLIELMRRVSDVLADSCNAGLKELSAKEEKSSH